MSTKIEWALIPGAPQWEVSTDGQLRHARTMRLLTPQVSKSGHLHVMVRPGGRAGQATKIYLHRAVLMAFVRWPWANEEGCHIDGDPTNNELRNLYWGTRLENVADKRRHGTLPIGEKVGSVKLTEGQVREIRRRYGAETARALGREFGVSHTTIIAAAHGAKWSHVA